VARARSAAEKSSSGLMGLTSPEQEEEEDGSLDGILSTLYL
jgi:hypothetical protein